MLQATLPHDQLPMLDRNNAWQDEDQMVVLGHAHAPEFSLGLARAADRGNPRPSLLGSAAIQRRTHARKVRCD